MTGAIAVLTGAAPAVMGAIGVLMGGAPAVMGATHVLMGAASALFLETKWVEIRRRTDG